MDLSNNTYLHFGEAYPRGVAEQPERRAPLNSSNEKQSPPKQASAAEIERAARYMDAVRELKSNNGQLNQSIVSKTFLDIAYFEDEARLVDTYA